MSRILKTVILAVVFALIGRMVAGDEQELQRVFMIYFACLPFGWRWASKVFTAYSIWSILCKAVFSMLLGLIALPVVLIGDIDAFVKERKATAAVGQSK